MFRYFMKLIIFIPFFYVNNVMGFTNKQNASDSYNLTIQMGNLNQITNLPKHDFAYVIKIPDSELYQGAPLEGFISLDMIDISTLFYSFDENNIDVYLKISDPAIGNRIIWQGKVIYNRSKNKVESIPEIVDPFHYDIKINIIQPREGRPQFNIGILSI